MEKVKCIVCGMIINDKNYDINPTTYLDENTEREILRCPFCGVTREFLSNDNDLKFSLDILDDKSLKILDMAMKLEVFNGEFYAEASKQANNKSLQILFKELSSIEWMHARVHKKIGGFKELPMLRKPDYSRHHSDKLLLKEACKREQHAIAFYQRYYNDVPSDIQRVFSALSAVEKEHIELTGMK